MERSFSLNNQNLVQSETLSKDEESIHKIVNPILYELLRESSADLTPKNEQNSKFFDLSA